MGDFHDLSITIVTYRSFIEREEKKWRKKKLFILIRYAIHNHPNTIVIILTVVYTAIMMDIGK